MKTRQQPQGSRSAYLSWLPKEKTVERVTSGGGAVTVVRTSGEACDDPASPYLGIQVLVEGEADLTCNLGRKRFRRHFRPGDFIVVPPDTDCEFRGPGRFQALSLAISKELVAKRFAELGVAPIEECDQLFDRTFDDKRISALVKILWTELGSGSENEDLFVDGLLQSVAATLCDLGGLSTATGEGRLTRRSLEQLREFVRATLHRRIQLEELARVADMSPSHFSKTFKEATGDTPLRFVQRERCERAKELLLEQRIPISAVAQAAGFCDQSHLTRLLKKFAGITPASYRSSKR